MQSGFGLLTCRFYRVENDDSITEDPNLQNGNEQEPTRAFAQDLLINAQQKDSPISLSIRNLNTLRNHHQPTTNGDDSHIAANQTIALDTESETSAQNQSIKHTRNPSSAKFDAFGNFIASSLIDLPEKNALELVEKFTTEIVRSLIAAKTANTSDKE